MYKMLTITTFVVLLSLAGIQLQAADPHTEAADAAQLRRLGLDNLDVVSETEGSQIRGRAFDFNTSFSYQSLSFTKFGPGSGLEFGSFTSISQTNNNFPTIVHSFTFPF